MRDGRVFSPSDTPNGHGVVLSVRHDVREKVNIKDGQSMSSLPFGTDTVQPMAAVQIEQMDLRLGVVRCSESVREELRDCQNKGFCVNGRKSE